MSYPRARMWLGRWPGLSLVSMSPRNWVLYFFMCMTKLSGISLRGLSPRILSKAEVCIVGRGKVSGVWQLAVFLDFDFGGIGVISSSVCVSMFLYAVRGRGQTREG